MVIVVISLMLLVARVVLVVGQRRGAGDIGLDAWWRRGVVDDVADRLHGLVRQALALVACQVDLNVGGLAVGALRSRGRQRIAPEVLDVFDVLRVGLELVDQAVVILVRGVAERLVAFQHDHRRAVGVELLEGLADALHRLQRRRVVGGQRHRMRLADLLQLRGDDVDDHDERDPAQKIGTENSRMKRGIIGCAPTWVLLMPTSPSRRSGRSRRRWSSRP